MVETTSRRAWPVIQYAPGSPEMVELFEEALRLEGLPLEWAKDPDLWWIMNEESMGGVVGIPNYTYPVGQSPTEGNVSQWQRIHADLRDGRIRAKSSATGLGQFLLDNVRAYYPDGVAGIGKPLSEARGFVRYMRARHRTPAGARANYNKRHEGW